MHWLNLILFALYQVVVVATIIHVVMENRQPVRTMAWALVIWFVPVVGIILYVFFGVDKRKERLVSRRQLDQLTRRAMLGFASQQNLQLPDAHKTLIGLFTNESFSLPFQQTQATLLTSGHAFVPRLLADIAQAQSHIHIDMYIFEDDALGRLVSDALVSRARQGVEVRIVYDDVGCWTVADRFFEQMREEGIEVVPFMPVRFPTFASRVNYRNHRKIIVIDGCIGYAGGMNIASRYVKGTADGQPWRDTMLRLEGGGVYGLQRAFLIDWYFADRTLLSDKKYYPPVALSATPADADGPLPLLAQTVTSGPVAPYPEIMQGYVRILMSARRYVYMETPYFLPTEAVFFAMKTAAQSGVDVRLLVPQKSDARLTHWASQSYLREAAEAGIRVSLYTAGFLHSKLLVSDDSICTCGSTNIDFRSFENNFESNVFLYGEALAREVRDVFLADERQSRPFADDEQLMHPRFLRRLWEGLVRLFAPLL